MNPDLDLIFKQLQLDPFARGLQILDARELVADAFPRLDTDRPALVFNVAASNLKEIARTLCVNYPAAHAVTLLQNQRVKLFTLGTITQAKLSRRAVLYLAPLAHASSPLTLANIMAQLRAPVGGCPWDLEQTHASITRALVEECYEVIEAISDGDSAHLQEELGDLLLHVLFQTQIARDQNEFSLSDVGTELAAKLIRRHPHVFGDVQAHDAESVIRNWEQIKREEKKRQGQTHDLHALDAGIPRQLPALTRAQKISERARRNAKQAANAQMPKRNDALQTKIARARDRERAVGTLLLEIAQIAEEHGIDAERALNAASKQFVQTHSPQKKE